MIEIIILCCGVTLMIANNPISCNGIPVDGCTYYDTQTIYISYWNPCIILHEYNEHILKKNNVIHHGVCV